MLSEVADVASRIYIGTVAFAWLTISQISIAVGMRETFSTREYILQVIAYRNFIWAQGLGEALRSGSALPGAATWIEPLHTRAAVCALAGLGSSGPAP
jgi:hypothetical protein